jgi:hypothetical protein
MRRPVVNDSSSMAAMSEGLAIATFNLRPSCPSGNTKCFSATAAGIMLSVAEVTASNSAIVACGVRVCSASTTPSVSMSR